jgi:hypothetical protein
MDAKGKVMDGMLAGENEGWEADFILSGNDIYLGG